VRVTERFSVDRPPQVVFDYVVDPSNLAAWQTSNRSVELLTDGPIGAGSRFRERTKPPGRKEFQQITEFAEFERPSRLRVRVVEGPQPIDGTWSFEPTGAGTTVTFVAAGELRGPMRLLAPLIRRVVARQFAGYHRNLRRNLEAQ
jgi:uncharacterized protein YndB with AHSA1/START domain